MFAVETTSDPGSMIAGILLMLLIIAAYWAPTIVAAIRQHHQLGSIAALNCFTGWTFIGWVAAAVWCFSTPTRIKVVEAG